HVQWPDTTKRWSEENALSTHSGKSVYPAGGRGTQDLPSPGNRIESRAERLLSERRMNDVKRISQDPWTPLSGPGEPTWEVARFYPLQGEWTEADYLALPTNQLVELSDGRLEFLPMPKHFHQMIVAFLYGT